MADKPHMIDWGDGKGPQPASTEQMLPVIVAHDVHAGVAYFPNCGQCVEARKRGEYPHWFPEEGPR